MRVGDLVDGRFALEHLAGSGGMGEVFRARDRATGALVAVKAMRAARGHETARFVREAHVLAELSHPGIVRYVAHGASAEGEPYIVMEWLEGEDLLTRLRRGALGIDETITLARRAAEALGAAHAQGIVHRDIKPSNIFLVEGDVALAKILDFGVAWHDGGARATRSGSLVGTPGYMAPEQARSGQVVDARADVFSLGCVIFECLTGAPVFSGDHFTAVLAKVLLEAPARVHDLRPDVPPALDALIAWMLDKQPEARPRDGAAVAAALASLQAKEPAPTSTRPSERLPALTSVERRPLSVIVLRVGFPVDARDAETLDAAPGPSQEDELRRTAALFGARLDALADGAAVVTLGGARLATDQAARAARCALVLRELVEGCPMALATGFGESTARTPLGSAIDRATRALAASLAPGDAQDGKGLLPIAIDEVTAGLLEARFDVREHEGRLFLHGERDTLEGTRTLLGRPTPCVGRERDLSLLEHIFAETVSEPMAHAVLVTAPAGFGKSRLVYEFLQRSRNGGEPVSIWLGRGDSLRCGSPFGLLGQAIRGACGIRDGEPIKVRRDKLCAKVAKHVPAAQQRRVAEFLAELVGAPMPGEGSVPLRMARQDALLMSEQMRQAWVDLVAAETQKKPLILVLEDLHWGDLPTVRAVDAALRELSERPFLVLALARPEVHTNFPGLWAQRSLQHIALKELSRRASEQLVRQVLGAAASEATVARIVRRAEGNAFYLEELIRAAAERQDEALPETVVAMVQSRLDALDARMRRLLRAASIFGETFWDGGVAALLGGSMSTPGGVGDPFDALVECELLLRRPASRFPGQREFAFRHALLREGAYATLTEEDRQLGHQMAGEWLEEQGEGDAMVLATHFAEGKSSARAGHYYAIASEQALRGGDMEGQRARALRGLACDVSPEVRATLHRLLCEYYGWRSEHRLGLPHAEEAMRSSPPGSAPWALGLVVKLGHASGTGDHDAFLSLLDCMRGVAPAPDALGYVTLGLTAAIHYLHHMDRPDLAREIHRQAHAMADPVLEREPLSAAWLRLGDSIHELCANEDLWASLKAAEDSRTKFVEVGSRPYMKSAQAVIGLNAWSLGAFELGERELREALAGLDMPNPLTMLAVLALVGLLVDRGELDQAHREATRGVELARASLFPPDEGFARWALSGVLLRQGDLDGAAREALLSIERLTAFPLEQAGARATLAEVRLLQGRAEEALAILQPVIPRFRVTYVRLLLARVQRACGDLEGARATIAAARDRLFAMAEKIGDPELRRSFLERVPKNARILELARRWLDA